MRIELLYDLISIVVSDGLLTKEEEERVKLIAKYIGIPQRGANSILAMFSFGRESYKSDKERKLNSNRQLELAYKILELSNNSSEQEIKSAFRRLVKIYHPDKLKSKEKSLIKLAKQKFQKIQEAYDFIKLKRGI